MINKVNDQFIKMCLSKYAFPVVFFLLIPAV